MSDLELIRRALQYNLDQESDFQDNADKDLAEKALAAFDRLVSQEPAAYPRTKDGEYQISPGANRPHDRAGGHSTPWTAIYTSPLAQQEAEPVDDGAMFDWIDARARETFSRHKSVARGQQITAADNPESHLIWAALKWAEAHPPKPAALPARCEYCNGSGDVHSFDGEWLGSCTECLPAAQPTVLEVGIRGKVYDPPKTCRAYTFKEQPDNVGAWRLGEAVHGCNSVSSGNLIDDGLGLLKHLEKHGFGVYELSAAKEEGK